MLYARRKNITQTLSSLSKTGQGRPISDTEILKWANTTAQKAKATVRPIRSFKDPSLTTGIFLLDLLEALRPGIVDPTLVINVSEAGDYEDRRQNGACCGFGCGWGVLTAVCSETCDLDRA